MTAKTLIKIDNVSKSYITSREDILALETVNLDIKEGEFVSLVGPSGCGKSTLLMLISGLYPSTTGDITIDNEPILKPYTNLGIVFQKDMLLEWRSVLDNVLLQSEIRKLNRADYEGTAKALLENVGLGNFLNRYPRELSGGMRQRVSICRALLHNPSLLLMDEPFGALDAITRDQMNIDLERIWEQSRKTVLFVTHSVPEAIFLSDRVLVMSPRPGRIVADIRIELPRPRTLYIRDLPEFSAYNREVRSIFREQGILVDEGDKEKGLLSQSPPANVDY